MTIKYDIVYKQRCSKMIGVQMKTNIKIKIDQNVIEKYYKTLLYCVCIFIYNILKKW